MILDQLNGLLPDATLLCEVGGNTGGIGIFQDGEFRIFVAVTSQHGDHGVFRLAKEWLLLPEIITLGECLEKLHQGHKASCLIRSAGLGSYLYSCTGYPVTDLVQVEFLFKTYIEHRPHDEEFVFMLNDAQLEQLNGVLHQIQAVWNLKR